MIFKIEAETGQKVLIMDAKSLLTLHDKDLTGTSVVMSITNNEGWFPQLSATVQSNVNEILYLRFDDIDESVLAPAESNADTIDINKGFQATRHDIEMIADFIKHINNKFSWHATYIISCDDGTSISSAIAAALLLYITSSREEDIPIWKSNNHTPNMYIFKNLAKALNLQLTSGEFLLRKMLNNSVSHLSSSSSDSDKE